MLGAKGGAERQARGWEPGEELGSGEELRGNNNLRGSEKACGESTLTHWLTTNPEKLSNTKQSICKYVMSTECQAVIALGLRSI